MSQVPRTFRREPVLPQFHETRAHRPRAPWTKPSTEGSAERRKTRGTTLLPYQVPRNAGSSLRNSLQILPSGLKRFRAALLSLRPPRLAIRLYLLKRPIEDIFTCNVCTWPRFLPRQNVATRRFFVVLLSFSVAYCLGRWTCWLPHRFVQSCQTPFPLVVLGQSSLPGWEVVSSFQRIFLTKPFNKVPIVIFNDPS